MSTNHFFWDNRRCATNLFGYRPVSPVTQVNRLVVEEIQGGRKRRLISRWLIIRERFPGVVKQVYSQRAEPLPCEVGSRQERAINVLFQTRPHAVSVIGWHVLITALFKLRAHTSVAEA